MKTFEQRVNFWQAMVIPLATVVILIAASTLLGWQINSPVLTGWSQNLPVNPLTAGIFLLYGVSLILIHAGRGRLALPLAALGWIAAFAKLLSYFGLDLKLDQVLFASKLAASRVHHPTDIILLFLGAGLIFMATGRNFKNVTNQLLGFAGLSVSALLLQTYIVTFTELKQSLIQASLPAAASGLLLGWAIVLHYSDLWPGSLSNADDPGGAVYRRLFAPAIFTPLVFGLLHSLSDKYGILSDQTSLALLVVFLQAGNVISIFVVALALQRNDLIRQKAESENRSLGALKDKFISILSHELQTPLTEIKVSSELLLDRTTGELSSQQKQLLEAINHSNAQAISRIRSMQTLWDVSRGGLVLEKQLGTLTEIVESVLDFHAAELERKHLRAELKPEKLAPFPMDLAKVRMAVDKLVENAIEYTPSGGMISLKIAATAQRRRLEIRDTGIGIPQPEQQLIFKSFYRASNAVLWNPDGEGVGLVMAGAIIQAHGGDVGFESAENKGSTFWLELPTKPKQTA